MTSLATTSFRTGHRRRAGRHRARPVLVRFLIAVARLTHVSPRGRTEPMRRIIMRGRRAGVAAATVAVCAAGPALAPTAAATSASCAVTP